LRSWTAQDYDEYMPDGNGGTRKGAWPLDYYFSSAANVDDLKNSSRGGGYTGYGPGRNPTARIGDIVVDRRDNSFYIGFCYQSRLPDGQPDFEPAVLAMTETGKMKWWSRLYHEFLDKNGNGRYDDGEPRTSTPDQYIDYLALDTKYNALVVGARCHGNNVINYWAGNKIASRPDTTGFQNSFTGSGGNFHISWLGKLGLDDGTLFAATYVAEMEDGMEAAGKPCSDPMLDGWPDPNTGWPKLNTTRLRALSVDTQGRVLIAGTGRRTITTSNAYQKMVKKSEGVSTWNDFVRVYKPDLSGLEYSSVLTGDWNKQSGEGGGNIGLQGVALVGNAIIAVGEHEAFSEQDIQNSIVDVERRKRKLKPGDPVPQPLSTDVIGKIKGNAMPVAAVPAWGKPEPQGASGVLALLGF
jgi:hypothetical protein